MRFFSNSLFSALFGLAITLTLTSTAHAINTFNESGELVSADTYKIGVEPQFGMSDSKGFDIGLFMDRSFRDDMGFRVSMGTGDTDYYLNGSLKWIPIPDYDGQPALGLKGGVTFWREKDFSFYTVTVSPLASKKQSTEYGEFVPYAALPIHMTNGNGVSKTSINLVLGSEWTTPEAPGYQFGAELGINAKDSYTYLSGYVAIFLDDSGRMK